MAYLMIDTLDGDLSGADRAEARDAFLVRLRKIKKNAQITKACREQFEAAYERFLTGPRRIVDETNLANEIIGIKCFKKFRKAKNEFGEIGIFGLYGGGGTYGGTPGSVDSDTSVRQIDTTSGTETSFVPGLSVDHVFDGILDTGLEKALLYVKEFGEGKIYSYVDADDDGFFDESTENLEVSDPILANGGLLAIDALTDELLIFEEDSNRYYRVDSGALILQGRINYSDPIHNIGVFGGNAVVSPIPEGDPVTPDVREGISAYDGDGTATPGDDFLRDAALALSAVFDKAPVVGDANVYVDGQPGDAYTINRWRANVLETAGSGILDADGKAIVPIAPPLDAADEVQVAQPTEGTSSFRFPAWPQNSVEPVITSMRISDNGGAWVQVFGEPWGSHQIDTTTDLQIFPTGSLFQQGGFGTSWHLVDPPVFLLEPTYIRVKSIP